MVRIVEKSGKSIDEAIVIKAHSPRMGILAEYKYVRKKSGIAGLRLKEQILIYANNKHYDRLVFFSPDNSEKEFYFDIESFFGKKEGLKSRILDVLNL